MTPLRWTALGRLAWRESRTLRRRLLLYMSSIGLGVAALVAIDSFTANITASVHQSSRALLGGDLALTGHAPLHAAAARLADSLAAAGARTARVTTFVSMATVTRTARTRLAQVRAVSADYPLVGTVSTDPSDAWDALQHGRGAIVDPSLLTTLDARIGDSLRLGYARFEIAGTIGTVPGDAGIAAAIGPRIFIPEPELDSTRLLVFGSRADYKTLVALPGGAIPLPSGWLADARSRLGRTQVRLQTAADAEVNLTNAIQRLSDFLGVVGIVALLLGGIGVASGVSAFVESKVDAAAVLRCLGATAPQVVTVYVLQAAAMGVIGAAAGAIAGVGIQLLLPIAARDFIPVDVAVHLVPRAIAVGLGIGIWVAVLFALRPLLGLSAVSPLQALRRDVESVAAPPPAATSLRSGRHRWGSPATALLALLIAGTVLAISVQRAPTPRVGVASALGIGATLALLWIAAVAGSRAARRLMRAHWPYVVRQGVANLYRPANHTRAVILALGFGAFLISTLYLVQSALLHEFASLTQSARANLLFFDVQEDQASAVDSTIRASGYTDLERTPIVTMRIAAINGQSVSGASLGADTDAQPDAKRGGEGADAGRRRSAGHRRAAWALRREYRSTYRDTVVGSERVVAGRWFAPHAGADPVPPVSFEADVASELGVRLGDTVTWDVQGVPIRTRVANLRDVDWARFEPNFFAVFPSGVLEAAPKQYVILTAVPNADAIMRLQRAVVDRYPNVSSIDLTLIRNTVEAILRKVTVAIRFLAVFCLVMGIPVLFSAVAATRRDRVREGVLLKILGGTRRQVGQIMFAEYAVLGALASACGLALSIAAAWALVRFMFDAPFVPAWAPLLGIGVLSAGLTIAIGLLSGREVFRDLPLAMIRAE